MMIPNWLRYKRALIISLFTFVGLGLGMGNTPPAKAETPEKTSALTIVTRKGGQRRCVRSLHLDSLRIRGAEASLVGATTAREEHTAHRVVASELSWYLTKFVYLVTTFGPVKAWTGNE